MPKVDPEGEGGPGGFPTQGSWDQGLNDFVGYMDSQGLDRAEGSVSEGNDKPGVFGLECGGVQTERDQCWGCVLIASPSASVEKSSCAIGLLLYVVQSCVPCSRYAAFLLNGIMFG